MSQETNYSPNLGEKYFAIDPSTVLNESGGSGSSGGSSSDPEVFKIAGSGTPAAAPVSGAGVAYNATGSFWVYSGGAWNALLT